MIEPDDRHEPQEENAPGDPAEQDQPPRQDASSAPDAELWPLPSQPVGTTWPTSTGWPESAPPARAAAELARLLDDAFAPDAAAGTTYAVVIVHRGMLVAERYGGALPHFDRPPEPVTPDTQLLSWSMAKSILHAAYGVALLGAPGIVDLDAPAPVPEWAEADDPRRAIKLRHLFEMRDGLDWREVYDDPDNSDVIQMLFGSGQEDMAAFAAARPPAHAPGTVFNYSSGTTNILAAVLGRLVGAGEDFARWLQGGLWGRIGAGPVRLGFDGAGTWVASSYVHATACDYARFGLLSLRGGLWDGERVLPVGWVDHGRAARSVDPEDGSFYGAQWWSDGDEWGSFRCAGYEGQMIVCNPALDLVLVRLGRTLDDEKPALTAWRTAVQQAFAP